MLQKEGVGRQVGVWRSKTLCNVRQSRPITVCRQKKVCTNIICLLLTKSFMFFLFYKNVYSIRMFELMTNCGAKEKLKIPKYYFS